ncbi:MAG TPA: phospholipase D-like domain-containing protein [Gemmatimonadaceae bacterium]|nr:phospholipase D-like domain-containing protein [Gemmatimonadaceae bacterium]
MTYILLLLGGMVGGLIVALVYMTLAANAAANHQDRVMSVPQIEPDLDQFLRALHGAAGARVLAGNEVELLQNGDEIFPPMLAAIRESQSTIHFSTYVYWAGAVPREFARALSDAAQRGVIVRLVLDSEGSEPMPHTLVHQMRDAGCKVTWFRRMRWFDWMQYNHRTHRRLLVVDGKIGFTGGVGIADEWTGHAQSPAHWRDTNVRLTGPIVAALQSAFTDNWNQSTEELLLHPRDFPHLTPAGDVSVCAVLSTPANGASSAQRVMAALIAGATRTLDISNAYFVPTPSFVDALCSASDRGVVVRILVPGPWHDKKIVQRASRHSWARLVAHGVGIHEYQPTMMHAKTVVADGELLLVGSVNFDPRSFSLNGEFGVVIVSRKLAADAMRVFEADIERSIPVLPATITSRGIANRAVDGICYWARAQL